MIFNSHVNGHSLAEEVRLAEEKLNLRRAALHDDFHLLDLAIRRRVTAPDSLLWGVGTGFILGELTKKHSASKAAQEKAADTEPDDESVERPGTLQLALRYWAVARPIITTAASILAPYLQAKAVVAGATEAVAQANDMPPAAEAMRQAGETFATHHHGG